MASPGFVPGKWKSAAMSLNRWRSFRRFLRCVGLGAIAFFFCVAFTPLPNVIAARSLVVAARLDTADAIIVLGGGLEKDGTLSPASLTRTVHGIRLFRQGFAPIVVFSGGVIDGQISEAAAMAAVAKELAIPSEAILNETESVNTATAAEALARVLHPRGIRRILLVSDAFHIPRAQAAFQRVEFEVLPAPTSTGLEQISKPEFRISLMRLLLGDLVGHVYYRLRGWI